VARQGRRGTGESESGAEGFPQVGDNMWKTPCPRRTYGRKPVRQSRAVHRWKAPRVQRISKLFAERRVRRPWASVFWSAQAVRCTVLVRCGLAARAADRRSDRATGLAKAGWAEATQAHVVMFARDGRPVRRSRSRRVVWFSKRRQVPCLHAVSLRFRDAGCPSGAGRGKATLSALERTV